MPWTSRKTNRWVLEKIKRVTFPEAKMTKLKLSYFGYIMRKQNSFEKTKLVGKIEGSRKRGRANMRWIDSVKESIGMSLQALSRTVEDRTCGHHSLLGTPEIGVDSTVGNTHKTCKRKGG